MAVINCPSCNKKVSNKAKSCSFCQLDLSNLDAEKIIFLQKENFIKKSQRLMTHSFIAMLLFCGGFLFYYWQDVLPGSWQYVVALTSTVIGFLLYITTRIRLILLKRSSS